MPDAQQLASSIGSYCKPGPNGGRSTSAYEAYVSLRTGEALVRHRICVSHWLCGQDTASALCVLLPLRAKAPPLPHVSTASCFHRLCLLIPPFWGARHRLCLVILLLPRPRHRLCLRPRHRVCIVFLLPPRPRHRPCLRPRHRLCIVCPLPPSAKTHLCIVSPLPT